MPTICIGRETIESLSKGDPVALGQDCYAIPASGFDHPYKRIAELEDALDDLVMEAGLGASGSDWEQAINRARDLLKSSSRAT